MRNTLPKEAFAKAWAAVWGADVKEVDETDLQLVIPWILYAWRGPDGLTFGEQYLASTPAVDATVREYIRASVEATFSFFEIRRVEKGRGVAVVDLLRGGDEVFVLERAASQLMLPRTIVFGKLVPFAGVLMFDGLAPRLMEPALRDELLRIVRVILDAPRRRRFHTEELHEHSQKLVDCYWMVELMASTAASAARPKPKLANTDGDDLVFCTSRFAVKAGERAVIDGIMSALSGLVREDDDEGRACFTWWRPGNAMHKAWDNTTLGRLILGDRDLLLETNSRPRDERLRALVGNALAGRVSFIETTTTDAMDEARRPRLVKPEKRSDIPPEVERAVIQETLERHYADWPDSPLPALKGKTPRDAVSTSAGRKAVDALLRDMEYRTASSPDMAGTYDFGKLRRALGLSAFAPGQR
jgi:hypothetical protein